MSAEPALAAIAEVRPFLRAVAHQVTYALGADPLEAGAEVRASDAERRALALLRAAGALDSAGAPGAGAALDEVSRGLLAEPAMLAAFFQNLDLLYEHGAPGADVVSRVLMRAMEL